MAGKADGSVVIDTLMNTSGFQTGVANMKKGFDGIGSAVGKLAKVMAGVFAVGKLVQFGKEAIELGSNLSEVQNVVDVTFENLSREINEFASNAIEQFGLSETAAKQYTSTMGAMLKSMGFTTREAADMGMAMTGLAADMASFYNLNAEDAFYKIRAGISGETEPLKQLGINLSVANLEQFALTQGINKSYNAMTQQEQALLRYNYLLSVTADAQGDFARTSDSWANQTRILSEQFKALKATIGQGLINIFLPVVKLINTLLAKLATVANAFKSFTELITGKKSSGQTTAPGAGTADSALPDTGSDYDAAAEGAENYADATEDAAKATKKANKANKTYLSGLDEIRRYSEYIADVTPEKGGNNGKNGGAIDELAGAGVGSEIDYGSLAEGETVVDELSNKFSEIKDILIGLFQPFKDSWTMQGKPTISAVLTALSGIKSLAQSVGASFYSVWTNGTGTTTLSNILVIVQNILTTIGNLSNGFTAAWNTAGTGTSIIQGIFDLLNTVLETIGNILGATATWAATLDFTPLLTSINGLLVSLQPLAQNIGIGLLWFYQNVLLPLASFVIEDVIPRFFQTLSNVLTIVNAVIETLKPLFQWFWDSVLLPIAEWTGGIFLQIWDGINTALQAFATWCEENPEIIQNVAIVIGAFFAAFKLASIITGVITTIQGLIGIISGAGGLSGVLGTLISTLGGPLTLAIAAVIAAGVLLYKNWDKIKDAAGKLKDWIIEKWGLIKDGIGQAWESVKTKTSNIWTGITDFMSDSYEKIKTTFSTIGDWFKGKFEAAYTNITTAFSLIGEWFQGKYEAVQNVFNLVGDWFKEKFETAYTNVTTSFSLIGEWFQGKYEDVQGVFDLVGDWFKSKFDTAYSNITTAFSGVRDFFSNVWKDIKSPFKHISDWFEKTFSAAWKKVKDVFSTGGAVFTGITTGILNGFKSVVNALIRGINNVITIPFSGINSALQGIKDVKIIDWYPFSWMPTINTPQIPYLATGAVIPPNAPFAAILGDQKHGTNVEAPLSTIEQAVTNAMQKNNTGGRNMTIRIPVILNGRQVFEAVIDEAKMKQLVSGRNPFEMV